MPRDALDALRGKVTGANLEFEDCNIMARWELRTSTREDHDRVDAVFDRFDLADKADYAAFLRAQAAALLPVERALDAADAEAVIADWPERRRAYRLAQDLADLGERVMPTSAASLELDSPEAILGALYVIEGSRLGGAMLAKRVPADLPRRYLAASDPARWRALVALIDESLVTSSQREEALRAARAVFGLFEHAAAAQAKAPVL